MLGEARMGRDHLADCRPCGPAGSGGASPAARPRRLAPGSDSLAFAAGARREKAPSTRPESRCGGRTAGRQRSSARLPSPASGFDCALALAFVSFGSVPAGIVNSAVPARSRSLLSTLSRSLLSTIDRADHTVAASAAPLPRQCAAPPR